MQFFISAVASDLPCTYVLGTLQELGTQGDSRHESLFAGLQFQRKAHFILVGEVSLARAYQAGLLALGVERERIICFEV